MAKLTAKRRRALKPSQFGLPGSRQYPLEDRPHAIDAKARASKQEHIGRISEATEEKIDRKADKVLGHGAKARTGKTRSWTGP